MPTLDRAVWEKLDPRKMPCNGDRYLVEKIEISNIRQIMGEDGQVFEMEVPVVDTYDRQGNKIEGQDPEGKAGFFMARIISKGNGHRLEADVTVPMFHDPGDVVLCERYTGREMKFATGTYRIVSQVDVLCRVDELSPVRGPVTELTREEAVDQGLASGKITFPVLPEPTLVAEYSPEEAEKLGLTLTEGATSYKLYCGPAVDPNRMSVA